MPGTSSGAMEHINPEQLISILTHITECSFHLFILTATWLFPQGPSSSVVFSKGDCFFSYLPLFLISTERPLSIISM